MTTVLGTDFYAECENGLIALVLSKLPTLFPFSWTVATDDTVLSKGAENFLVVRPGRFPYRKGDEYAGWYDWEILGDLYIRYQQYKTSWDRFKQVRTELIHLAHMYPNLDNVAGVEHVSIESREKPMYFKLDEGKIKSNFIIQTLEFTVRQYVVFAGGEL